MLFHSSSGPHAYLECIHVGSGLFAIGAADVDDAVAILPYLDTPADSMEHGWFLKPIKVDKSRLCAVCEYDLLLH